jgi:superfamily II DNA helicase RecQ
MGVDIPDIRHVIHVGPSTSVNAGRDWQTFISAFILQQQRYCQE